MSTDTDAMDAAEPARIDPDAVPEVEPADPLPQAPTPATQRTEVSCWATLELPVPSEIELLCSVARPQPVEDELLTITCDGEPLQPVEDHVDAQGTRVHLVSAGPGKIEIRYEATVSGWASPRQTSVGELVVARRPSRYAESDRMLAIASAEFDDSLSGLELALAIRDWVNRRLIYVSGSSRATDGAVATLLGGAGVCRDYAHLVIALLRAREIPARLAAVYAPGLSPMDFHAVAEAWVDDRWILLDATGLAPRQHMIRIATGRDAADTAWMTVSNGRMRLRGMGVKAVALDGLGPDVADPVVLA